jgi:hypothetical protein
MAALCTAEVSAWQHRLVALQVGVDKLMQSFATGVLKQVRTRSIWVTKLNYPWSRSTDQGMITDAQHEPLIVFAEGKKSFACDAVKSMFCCQNYR